MRTPLRGLLVIVATVLCATACSSQPDPRPSELASSAKAFFSDLPLGLDPLLPVPAENPLTKAKVELGRRLFSDRVLSRDSTVACATCHEEERRFTDGRPVARGIEARRGRRNVPSLLNRAYGRSFFWDGRAGTLEEQVLQPMVGSAEMGNTHTEIVRRVSADGSYRRGFTQAFGTEEVTTERVAQALASFVRTLVTGDSPFDRYELLGDSAALSTAARSGLRLFRGKARCSLCHTGSLFTDERFHNTGVAWRDGVLADSGRFVVTGRREDLGAFKTPALREVTHTAPYMHDGSLRTLAEVIDFYDRGGNASPTGDPLIEPLELSRAEKADLLAFLGALSSEPG